ncbi:MAG: NAD-binding protein [Firmicutes bacterium]|nr:NAD-binding protein [Bacillota bacterium]
MREKIRHLAKKIVNSRSFELFFFLILVVSIVFIFIELVYFPHNTHTLIHIVNDVLLVLLAMELFLRYLASSGWKSFLSNYWVDLLALIPFIRPLRFFRIVRVLALLRIVSLTIFARRHLRSFAFLFRKKLIDYIVLLLIIVSIIVFATLSFVCFEPSDGPMTEQTQKAFWTVLFSMFTEEYANNFPATIGGKLTILFTAFCGMSFFAFLTGTVSAIMIERLREGTLLSKFNFEDMEDHVIICGWSDRTPTILSRMQKNQEYRDKSYIIISDMQELPDLTSAGVDMSSVFHIKQDFVSSESLKLANIQHASTAIILADNRGRTVEDTDARTVLTALTIEKLNPGIYSCAELLKPENEQHLRMSGIENVILPGNVAAFLISQASMKSSIMPFFNEILDPGKGNDIVRIPADSTVIGQKFNDILAQWKKEKNMIIAGVSKKDGSSIINPGDYTFEEDDTILAIGKVRKSR